MYVMIKCNTYNIDLNAAFSEKRESETERDRQRDNQISRGQRVSEVRDELSLASVLCGFVFCGIACMRVCVISVAADLEV